MHFFLCMGIEAVHIQTMNILGLVPAILQKIYVAI